MTKILVVEDHIGIREAYEILFLKEGYKVTPVEDGKLALEETEKAEFDIILLDMVMPTMDGIEFLRAFLPENHPDTKIIIFSNLENEETLKEAMSLGAHRYIRKSTVPPKEMAAIVKEVLAEA